MTRTTNASQEIVAVYCDPVTEHDLEGHASLVRRVKQYADEPVDETHHLECWMVLFPGDIEYPVQRWVKRPNKEAQQ